MVSAAIDNDILKKLAVYRLPTDGLAVLGGVHEAGVLGAARFVIPSAIRRDSGLVDPDGALAAWQDMFSQVVVLEPSQPEVELAVMIEESAARGGLPLDSGESQLMAIAILRPIALFVSGDKRAIAAAELLRPSVHELAQLDGRVICLEQIIERLTIQHGGDVIRTAVCAEPKADRALSTCMRCASLADGAAFSDSGLKSYIADLRNRAVSLLGQL